MIIATAGHVDHGKTSLIAALTGVDTDKLPEEKKRGLSIDLGFAYLPAADAGKRAGKIADSASVGQVFTEHAVAEPDSLNSTSLGESVDEDVVLGFIDVPGHEKFVRNMIAGVGSVDMALLVVAADDGPMPQTREHLAILQLLGVESLVVVVSKIDLVEQSRVDEVCNDITQLLDNTVYKGAAIHAVSIAASNVPASGNGAIDRLREHLFQSVSRWRKAKSSGHFRLAVDRCFHVTGAGTVVTGTVVSGAVRIDDALTVLSDQKTVRVRGIHAQSKSTERAVAGQRCALNLAGGDIRKSLLARGDWVTSSARMVPVRSIDVHLTPVAQSASAARLQQLAHWTPAHLHLGTASVPCRIALLASESLEVGQFGLARLLCERPLGAVHGDRFVLRDQSARFTIAGGVVVDPLPPRRGRSRPERLQVLQAMKNTSVDAALSDLLDLSPYGIDLAEFATQYNLRDDEINALVTQLLITDIGSGEERWGITEVHWQKLQSVVLATLQSWHTENTGALGADQEQLLRSMPQRVARPVFARVLVELQSQDKLVKQAAVYRSPQWQSRLGDHSEMLWQRLQPFFQRAGLTAPRVLEIAEFLEQPADDIVKLLNACVAHGRLYKVSGNRYYTPTVVMQLAALGEELAEANNFSVAAYRDKSGIGRNLVIELLEFFDRCRFTRRVGQQRVVLQSADSVFGA